MIIRVFVAAVFLAMSAMAMADLAYKASQGLRGLKSANIFIEDQITDGCWSNPSRSAYKARKIFVDGVLAETGLLPCTDIR